MPAHFLPLTPQNHRPLQSHSQPHLHNRRLRHRSPPAAQPHHPEAPLRDPTNPTYPESFCSLPVCAPAQPPAFDNPANHHPISASQQLLPVHRVQQHPIRSLSVQPDMTSRNSYLADHHPPAAPIPVPDTIRRPLMFQAKYGSPNNWALDIFTLPHNAIRAECVDLYNILESIHARSHNFDVLEMEEFNVWWTAYEAFVIEYFDFEADLLFPWVFVPTRPNRPVANPPQPVAQKLNAELLLRNSLLSRKEALLDSIRQLNGTFELRRHVDVSDVFHTVLEEVNDFVPKLLEYFHMQERHLPPIVSRFHNPSSKESLLKKYLQYIKKGESPQMNLVLLSRWMDGEAKDKWIRTYIRGYSRLMHKRWERRCNRTHGHIAFKFHRRLLRSVRSVAASRLRRRTEFGEEIDDISFGSFPSQAGSIRSLSLAVQSRGSTSPKTSRSREMQRSKARVR